MYLGQSALDVPLTTVQQDPLATVASSAYPGLVMNAPDILVGLAPAPANNAIMLLIVGAIAYYFLSKKG